jgi:6-phosphogluconate dehydrogenase
MDQHGGNMEIGVIGLGRMGANMARRMARGGARVVAFDREAKGA